MSQAPDPGCIYGVVGVIEERSRFLMIKRSRHVRAPGMWCFPGGAIEAGESAAEAVAREFHEEIGLIVEPLRMLWSWLRDDGGLHLEWWQVRRTGGELRLKPDEVEAVEWLSDAEIRARRDMIPNNITFLDHYRRQAR